MVVNDGRDSSGVGDSKPEVNAAETLNVNLETKGAQTGKAALGEKWVVVKNGGRGKILHERSRDEVLQVSSSFSALRDCDLGGEKSSSVVP
ncbi:hypothetical protein Dimus_003619, partial [Dionaea muscipula]